jgi:4-amino-4-deoxy-L-arabinose transferase-like glycosyltransferase
MALGVVLLAAATRLPTLGLQSFWLDEGYTEHLVHSSFGSMLHAIPRTESTPPVYYVVAWVWTRAFGYSEWGIRSLSALAGILTVAVVYATALRLAGRRAALIAGALTSLSPLLIWFSQEARSYALATLLSTVTLWCLLRFRDRRDVRWLVGWTLSSALGVATHYFVVFVVAAEAAWLLWDRRRDRRVLVAVAVLVAVVGALVPLALAQRGTGHADYIAQGSLGTRLAQVPKQLLVGYASPLQALSTTLAAVIVLAGLGVALICRRDERASTWGAPLAVGLTCILAPVLLALTGVDFLNTRNLLPALPLLLVAVAIWFAVPRRGVLLAAALALVFVAVTVLVDANPRYRRDDWRGASRALGAPTRARVVVISPGSGFLPLELYQRGLRPLSAPVSISELDVVALPPRRTGQGISPAPSPLRDLAPPPGFHLARSFYAPTYTVLRFRAQAPTEATPASIAASHLDLRGFTSWVQR